MKYLLVEDNLELAEAIASRIRLDGHAVDHAATIADARAFVNTGEYDLILLDIMLPDGDGRTFLKQHRAAKNLTSVIVLTARSQVSDRIGLLDLGADDYLTKPFDLDILEARMNALVRRYRGKVASSKLQFGELTIDQKTRKAYRQDKLLALNPTTYTILEMLCQSAPEVVTREDISYKLWEEDEPNNDVLRSHIYQLRNQLDKPFDTQMLITVPKVGFRLESSN